MAYEPTQQRWTAKVRCTVCGVTGYHTNGSGWQECHKEHVQCDVEGCKRWITKRGMGQHRAWHRKVDAASVQV